MDMEGIAAILLTDDQGMSQFAARRGEDVETLL
jgi:hypothetical protein